MEQYRTEEEQVEALRKWWDENGRSTIAAVIIALSLGFGWQTWKGYSQDRSEAASNTYQAMLQQLGVDEDAAQAEVISLAQTLKTEYKNSTYAQFAALHLARLAVEKNDLATAEAELRWVLGQAGKGSETAQLAQLRLARVLAAKGQQEQALSILQQTDPGTYQAAYAIARGDVLLMLGRESEAREAYNAARLSAARGQRPINLAVLEQKLQSLSPIPAKQLDDQAQPVEELIAEAEAVAEPEPQVAEEPEPEVTGESKEAQE